MCRMPGPRACCVGASHMFKPSVRAAALGVLSAFAAMLAASTASAGCPGCGCAVGVVSAACTVVLPVRPAYLVDLGPRYEPPVLTAPEVGVAYGVARVYSKVRLY